MIKRYYLYRPHTKQVVATIYDTYEDAKRFMEYAKEFGEKEVYICEFGYPFA